MEDFKFDLEQKKMIVDAIVEGYRDYAAHRLDRSRNMVISSAFSYTKGNFIDSKVAEECSKLGFTFKKSKAGLAWVYLQFEHGETKRLFLIKNNAYFDPESFSRATLPSSDGRKGAKRTYLHELSKINSDISFEQFGTYQVTDHFGDVNFLEQPSFFTSEEMAKSDLQNLNKMYNEFHILTYTIDDAFQISEIKQYLPNPENNKAYLIDNLSDFISGAELGSEERDVLAPESQEEIYYPGAYDIGILSEEKVK